MNRYDRPIPRRMLEESGVDREMFGQRKRAVGVTVTEEGLDRTMTSASLVDFGSYCQQHWNWRLAATARIFKLVRAVQIANDKFNRLVAILFRIVARANVNLPNLIPRPVRAMTYGYLGQESLLIHWSVSKLMPRYQLRMNAEPEHRECERL